MSGELLQPVWLHRDRCGIEQHGGLAQCGHGHRAHGAYWKGGYSGGANVWAISDGSSTSNWTTDSAGTSATGQVAGANTKVIFSATGASNQTDMTLGADMAVGSLEFNNTAVAALNDLDNKLTVNGASAVSVTSTGAVTLNTNLVLANSQATVNVANAAGVLNLQGTVTGNGLTKTGSGRLAVSGTQSFSGSVLLNAGTTYFGGTTTVNSLTLAAGARLEGSGTVTSVAGMTIGGTLAVGDESLSSAVASTLTLASGSGTLTFQTGSVITLDLVNGAGTGGGESDLLVISGVLVIGADVSLQVETNNMTTWAIGDTWQLIDWTGLTSRTGTFVTTELDSALSGTGLSWDYSNLYTTGAITLSAVPEPPGRCSFFSPSVRWGRAEGGGSVLPARNSGKNHETIPAASDPADGFLRGGTRGSSSRETPRWPGTTAKRSVAGLCRASHSFFES
ncbi:hypothetical protein [Verrucomicrobium spinosum]|uniref:hypothetical protein n=1 Tax=Verrucomicrobium spinosum TaxID=2736 RepID=UPI000946564F|nr:hypothetical protein [Verrucomicrobium spinosum]